LFLSIILNSETPVMSLVIIPSGMLVFFHFSKSGAYQHDHD